MKIAVAAAVASILLANTGYAARLAVNPACLASAHGMFRVSDMNSGNGIALKLERLRCAQFLSTTVVARPAHSEHT